MAKNSSQDNSDDKDDDFWRGVTEGFLETTMNPIKWGVRTLGALLFIPFIDKK